MEGERGAKWRKEGEELRDSFVFQNKEIKKFKDQMKKDEKDEKKKAEKETPKADLKRRLSQV